LFLFLSGWVLIRAFFVCAASFSGFNKSVKDSSGHSGQIWCSVDSKVVKLLIVLAPEYPHFWSYQTYLPWSFLRARLWQSPHLSFLPPLQPSSP
jgi:hypothetical protein